MKDNKERVEKAGTRN